MLVRPQSRPTTSSSNHCLPYSIRWPRPETPCVSDPRIRQQLFPPTLDDQGRYENAAAAIALRATKRSVLGEGCLPSRTIAFAFLQPSKWSQLEQRSRHSTVRSVLKLIRVVTSSVCAFDERVPVAAEMDRVSPGKVGTANRDWPNWSLAAFEISRLAQLAEYEQWPLQ